MRIDDAALQAVLITALLLLVLGGCQRHDAPAPKSAAITRQGAVVSGETRESPRTPQQNARAKADAAQREGAPDRAPLRRSPRLVSA
ncbi:hypothetical protein [Propionivibrio soli]|uniref:hypothetical protein n=1 Tax=Propionivibrio soli TaxID=2976531 RepID=UPI0021E986C7|nr:hypothetical protein [Propionivibrio soli]